MSKLREIFILILISNIVQLNCENDWAKDTREFWTAYFGVIKGKDFKLDEDCLSGKFNDYFDELNKSFLTRDVIQIFITINKMIELEFEKCPLTEYATILRDFRTASNNGTLIKNVMKNITLIREHIMKYVNSDRSKCAFGTCVGQLTKIVTYGMSFSSWKDSHDHENTNTNNNNFLN